MIGLEWKYRMLLEVFPLEHYKAAMLQVRFLSLRVSP
jgi:hypothetical protein